MSTLSRNHRRISFEPCEPRLLLSTVPLLHSHPESAKKIFLDFDGHVVVDGVWNASFGHQPIHAPPFDMDGVKYGPQNNPTFSQQELLAIEQIWARVAEDFLPFDVDVTTEDPTSSDPTIFTDGGRGQRVLLSSKYDEGVGGTGERWLELENNGIAGESWDIPADDPVWVFSNHPAGAGEIASHELGHALTLRHDGLLEDFGGVTYYAGHGTGETKCLPFND